MKRARTKPLALCVDNTGSPVSLIYGKVSRILPDAKAAKHGLVRIVDERSEDYYCHRTRFVFGDYLPGVKKKLPSLQAAA